MTARADLTCDQVLSKCDKALKTQIEVNGFQKAIIDQQEERFKVTDGARQDAESSRNTWRTVALISLVVIGTGAAVEIIRR